MAGSPRYVLTGTSAGATLCAPVSSAGLEIGRSNKCDLTVVDLEVSRVHCVVRTVDGKVTVEDRSQNGTFVNGERIAAVAELKAGDVLRIGSTELTLREGEVPASVPTAVPDPAPVLQPGDMVDRYRIRRLIGRGGMGTVYEVEHTGLDLPYALKALTLPDDPSYAGFREKFLDEGKILARLRHENITQVHDAAYDEKTRTLFFVMDLVLYDDGSPCTLADVAFDECDVSNWFASLASALDYIHRQGIVHSDLKLQNVLVSSGQKIKLADFGVAHLLSGKMRSSLRGADGSGGAETIGYTAHYVAPEILTAGALPSVASDVYALGVLLVRLLSGKWYDECPSVLNEIAAKRALNWRPVLAQMLAADPKRRVTGLMQLVTQLRHGSKAPLRRKFQIENRRRRAQKVRLRRAVNIQTGNLPSPFAPESKRSRIVRYAFASGLVLAAVLGVVWLQSVKTGKEKAERERIERLEDARGLALRTVQKAMEGMPTIEGRLKGEFVRLRQEFAAIEGLSRTNATGSTDRVTAERRNDVLLRYDEVLKFGRAVRDATADFARLGESFDDRIGYCRDEAGLAAVLKSFEAARREKTAALDAASADLGRTWSGYEEAKSQLDGEVTRRACIGDERNRTLSSVRQVLEAETDLATASELVQAREKIEEGDRLLADGSDGGVAATNCYVAARTLLADGCARLRQEREERGAIEQAFQRCDEEIRLGELPKLRSGASSLAVVAVRVQEVSGRFADEWKRTCRFASNTGAVAACSFALRASAAYLGYLANVLGRSHDGVDFTLSPKGVNVDTKRGYAYGFSWNVVFSSRRQDTKAKEKYRQKILGFCQLPSDRKWGVELLAGRWIVMREMMPAANTDEELARLAEAVRADRSEAALAWAQRTLPAQFPAEEKPTADDPAPAFADLPQTAPEPKADSSHERLIFFVPSQGLSVPAIGPEGIEISLCARVKDSRRVRFQVRNGEFFSATGVRRPFADVEEGQTADFGSETLQGVCSLGPVSWHDDPLGDGRPLVLIRVQHLPDEER